jgi:O-antigen ligase
MPLLGLLIATFGFVDILSSWRIGDVSAAAIEWTVLGFCALCFVVLRGSWYRIVTNNGWFVALAIFSLLNAYKTTDYASAAVDLIYITIPLLFWGIAYRSVSNTTKVLTIFSWILLSILIPIFIILASVLLGTIEHVEGLGPELPIGVRSAALLALPIVSIGASILVFSRKSSLSALRWCSVAALFLGVVIIFGTLSRTSILCVVIYAGLLAWVARRIRAVAITGLGGLFAIVVVLTVPALKERVLPDDMPLVEALESGAYTSGRALIWSALWNESLNAPWLGHGTGNSKPYIAERFPGSAGIPHNEYLRNLFDGGALGLLLVTLAWTTRMRRYYILVRVAVRRKEHFGAAVFSSALLCASGVAIAGFFDNAFLYIFLTGNAFIVFGIADRYGARGHDAKALQSSSGLSRLVLRPIKAHRC